MKPLVRYLTIAVLSVMFVHAQEGEASVEQQAEEIKQLKRELAIKEQEIKILLITLKNAQQEGTLGAKDPKNSNLNFQTVNNSATRVIVKPSMLSETAIKEIDKDKILDTDTMSQKMEQDEDIVGTIKNMDATKTAQTTETTQAPIAKETQVEVKEDTTQQTAVAEESKLKVLPKLSYMKATKFEVTEDAPIFTAIFKSSNESWQKGQRFTSNKRRGDWIQITGKITDKGWEKITEPLWIEQSCTKKLQ